MESPGIILKERATKVFPTPPLKGSVNCTYFANDVIEWCYDWFNFMSLKCEFCSSISFNWCLSIAFKPHQEVVVFRTVGSGYRYPPGCGLRFWEIAGEGGDGAVLKPAVSLATVLCPPSPSRPPPLDPPSSSSLKSLNSTQQLSSPWSSITKLPCPHRNYPRFLFLLFFILLLFRPLSKNMCRTHCV